MKQIFSFLTFASIVLVIFFSGTCKNDSPVKPPPPPVSPDTTSHEYEWRAWLVGGWGTHLDDVFALSPDFAIAVGEIDDSSEYPRPHNCYIWNGTDLEPYSLPINNNDTVTINSNYSDNIINSIWMFRRDNIWYAMDNKSTYAHLTIAEGDTNIKSESNLVRTDINGAIGQRIFAKDTNDIFFGGTLGAVIQYHNNNWTRYNLETARNYVTDLWGLTSNNVYMCANGGDRGFFYRYDGAAWNLLWTDYLPSLSDSVFFGQITSIWGVQDQDSIWTAGLWLGKMKKDGTGKIKIIRSLQPYGILRIRGSKCNNVFFVGGMGAILHYNGSTLHFYDEFYGNDWILNSLTVLENDVFIVGRIYGAKAGVFIHGKRIHK